ncbi:dynamin central region protein [Ceratobasidium sp. AG-Ba]|nr:dynamin central region protein [Ceratobasidium sp. AG-Ba]
MSNSSFSSGGSISEEEHDSLSPGVGIAASSYGTQQRKLLDLVNRLHNTGIQSDIDLPQICVVGSQSAGKSSLIESISGIKLPRATGTCTRCPTELRLAFANEPWHCTVHLRFLKDENGDDISPIRNVAFGGRITKKEEVEERLRRAQLAILNPGKDSAAYLDDDIPASSPNSVAFSENFISVEITGPDVTNLSFCDLPGIIANVREGSDEGDIELVKRLVTSYIKKESCIILLTVTCETDFENQGARSLAKQYDPQGKRTIGVLTKPDRIEKGEEQKWLGFIRGETETLSKGWFCVKQPNPTELQQNLTWAEARSREEDFFKTQEPWSSQLITVRQHFGTARLTTRLSEILSDQIAKRMPSLLDEIQRLSHETQENLRALPAEVSDDPAGVILNLITDFHREVATHVEGVPDGDGLVQQIRAVQDKFRQAVRRSAPDFRPFKRPTTDKEKEKALKMPGIAFLDEDEVFPVDQFSDHTLFEEDISKLSKEAVTRELPKNVPFIVKRKLIKNFVDQWNIPTMTLLEDVERILSAYMRKLVDGSFKQHAHGGLLNAVRQRYRFWEDRGMSRTFTTNTHYLADYKDKFTNYYRTVRKDNEEETSFVKGLAQGLGADTEFAKSMSEVIANLNKMGISMQPQDLARLLNPDPSEDVIDIMAEVRAYYQVAYKRFVDIIPMTVDETLVRGFSRGLEKRLFEGLGVSGDNAKERCAALLAQSHDITLERDMLKTRRERLDLAKKEISTLWGN